MKAGLLLGFCGLLAVTLTTSACASVAPAPAPVAASTPDPSAAIDPVGFSFATDTFAFPNQIAAHHPGEDGIYAHYCFVLAKGVRQFFEFARFEPDAPRLDAEEYEERVRRLASLPPWGATLPPEERVVIPGYANLREFSEHEERAVKEGLGPSFWTLVHWTNWRVTFPVTRGQQQDVAEEVVEDLRSGRLSQLLVTDFPRSELNHTVVAYDYRETETGVELTFWDPNDPSKPGTLRFDRTQRRFYADQLYATEPGRPIRVFRVYYSPFL